MTVTFEGFGRTTADPAIQDGKPCIRGMRLTAQRVLDALAFTAAGRAVGRERPST